MQYSELTIGKLANDLKTHMVTSATNSVKLKILRLNTIWDKQSITNICVVIVNAKVEAAFLKNRENAY